MHITGGGIIFILVIVVLAIVALFTAPKHRLPYHEYDAHGDKMPSSAPHKPKEWER